MASTAALELVVRLNESASAGLEALAAKGDSVGKAFDDLNSKASKFGGSLGGAGDAASGAGGKFGDLANKASMVPGPMGDAAGAATGLLDVVKSVPAPLLAIGGAATVVGGALTASVGAWSDWDAGVDTFVSKTGATEEAAQRAGEGIKGIKASAAGLGHDMAEIGSVMGEVSTRTGATGEELDGLTSQVLKLSNLTGGDAASSVRGFARLMQDWDVPLSDSKGLLDKVYGAAQKFGVSVDGMNENLTKFSPALRGMGLSLDDSIVLLGKFEKSGVNTEVAMAALQKATVKFAQANIPMKDGLNQAVTAIKSAATETEALNIAAETFGAKGAAEMVEAIRTGKFEAGELGSALDDTAGSIDSATERGLDFGDKWDILWAGVKTALIPVGQALMDLGSMILPIVSGAFQVLGSVLNPIVSVLGEMAGWVGKAIEGWGKLGEIIGDAFSGANVRSQLLDQMKDLPIDKLEEFANAAGHVGESVEEMKDRLNKREMALELIAKINLKAAVDDGSAQAVADTVGTFLSTVGREMPVQAAAESAPPVNVKLPFTFGLGKKTYNFGLGTSGFQKDIQKAIDSSTTAPVEVDVPVHLKPKAEWDKDKDTLDKQPIADRIEEAFERDHITASATVDILVKEGEAKWASEEVPQRLMNQVRTLIETAAGTTTMAFDFPVDPNPVLPEEWNTQMAESLRAEMQAAMDQAKALLAQVTFDFNPPVPALPEEWNTQMASGITADAQAAIDEALQHPFTIPEDWTNNMSTAGTTGGTALANGIRNTSPDIQTASTGLHTISFSTLQGLFTTDNYSPFGLAVGTGVQGGIIGATPNATGAATTLATGVTGIMSGALTIPIFHPFGLAAGDGVKGGLDAATPGAKTSAQALSDGVKTTVFTALTLEAFHPFGLAAGSGVQSGVTDSTPGATKAASDMAGGVHGNVGNVLTVPAFTSIGANVGSGTTAGITRTKGDAEKAAAAMAAAVKANANPGSEGTWAGIGANIAIGLAAGIRNNAYRATNAAADLAAAAINAATSALNSNSPSKVFYAIGDDVVVGFANGMSENAKKANDAVVGLVGGAILGIPEEFTTGYYNVGAGLGVDIKKGVEGSLSDTGVSIKKGVENSLNAEIKKGIADTVGSGICESVFDAAQKLDECEGIEETGKAVAKGLIDSTTAALDEQWATGMVNIITPAMAAVANRLPEEWATHVVTPAMAVVQTRLSEAWVTGMKDMAAETGTAIEMGAAIGLSDDWATRMMHLFDDPISKISDQVNGNWQSAMSGLVPITEGIIGQILALFQQLYGELVIVGQTVSGLGAAALYGSGGTYLPGGSSVSVVPQAHGGDWLVRKPTLFLAGEAGPERATFSPVGGRGRGGGGGNVYIGDIHVTAGPGANGGQIGRDIARALDRELGVYKRLKGAN